MVDVAFNKKISVHETKREKKYFLMPKFFPSCDVPIDAGKFSFKRDFELIKKILLGNKLKRY